MKIKLPMGISVALSLILVVFGLLYGTWSGYQQDRRQVDELLSSENGLMDVLDYRAADGLNLCVVARRHLDAADESLAKLEKAARELQGAQTLDDRRAADGLLGEAVAEITERLRGTEGFVQSERDGKYLDMLTADLNNLAGSAAVTTYNEAARAFNEKLTAPVSGWLAALLGIGRCPLYE